MTASVFNELDKALYSRLTGGTALMALVSSVWQEVVAPDSAGNPPAAPYVLFRMVTPGTDNDFVGGQVEVLDYDVIAVDNARYPDRGGSALAEIHALLHHRPLTVTGYSNTGIWRTATFRVQDDDGYWNVGATYRIRLSS
jgi:hypothetical protein